MSKRFARTGMSSSAGTDPALVLQGRVVGINLVNWTVNIVCTFDRKKFFDIQIGSPYTNFNNGEGFYAFPEVGSICQVCVPGDTSPPFVLSFLMPHELTNGAADDAPLGTRSHGAPPANATDASFAGGRPRAKPGDMGIRGRDGNFVRLHRGGVLEIGATALSQRIFVPLNNLIIDVSENYAHYNTGGAVLWGLQDGPSQTNFPTQYMQTFRVFANDKYADVRLCVGKVYNPYPEPDGGTKLAAAGVGQGADNPIICELSVSPKGFVAETGDSASPATVKTSVLKFVFDRQGNVLFRMEGNLSIQVKKKMIIAVEDDIEITGQKALSFVVKDGAVLDGGASAHIKGKLVRLGPGTRPVARLSDLVQSYITQMPAVFIPIGTLSANVAAPAVPIPGTISIGVPPAGIPAMPITGTIVSAEPTVLT